MARERETDRNREAVLSKDVLLRNVAQDSLQRPYALKKRYPRAGQNAKNASLLQESVRVNGHARSALLSGTRMLMLVGFRSEASA